MRRWGLSLFILCFSMSWAIFAAPTEPVQLFSVPIIAASLLTELLSRFNYVFKGKLTKKKEKKKTCPCFRGSYLMPRCWITPPSIGLDHALVMRLADYVFFPGFVLNGVPVVFPFLTPLSSRGMICQRGWKVPNGHSCKTENITSESTRWGSKKKKNDVNTDVCFLCFVVFFILLV